MESDTWWTSPEQMSTSFLILYGLKDTEVVVYSFVQIYLWKQGSLGVQKPLQP